MESFEAIVRNLEQVQRRGLETMTNRLDFVIESLQELVNEATASVREAMPADAEELFPVAEVRTAIQAAQARTSELAGRVAELESQLEALRQAPAPVPGGPSLEMLRTLDAARSQSELLRHLLPILAEHAARVVVLVLREGRVSAWSGIGLSDADRLRLWSGEAVASPALERLTADMVPCRFEPEADPVFSTWLAGEPAASEALLVPVVLRGRLVGAIYADRVEGQAWDPGTVQSLTALSCWLIDTLPYRQTVPSPGLAEPQSVGEAPAPAPPAGEFEPAPTPEAVAELEAPAEPEPEAAPAPESPPEKDAQQAPSEEVEEAAGSEVAPQPEPAPEPEGPGPACDPSATMQVDVVEAAAQAAAEASSGAEPEVEERPAPPPEQPVTPPPPEQAPAASADEWIPPEHQPLHEEAKRFARLLVSEIKLYNEDEVEQGRANHDIYQRLKEDIDRSREMYDQRVAPEVREVRDYFHEELVRILGGGDPDALGM